MWFISIWCVPLQNGTESRSKLKTKFSAGKVIVKWTELQTKYRFSESWCCLPASSKVSVQVVTVLQLFWLCVLPSAVLGFSLEDVGCDGSVKHHALLPTATPMLNGVYIFQVCSSVVQSSSVTCCAAVAGLQGCNVVLDVFACLP